MNEMTAVNNPLPPVPVKAQGRAGQMAIKFAAGVRESFPVVSIRGKVWRIKWQGQENMLLNTDGSPMPFLDVVFVNVSEHISKIYYEKAYGGDGDNKPPDCWSVNGITPDRASPKLQSATCAGCPQNVFGSRVTDAGKKAKACQDSRRTAVMLENDLMLDRLGPALLRAPQSSLKPLKEFMMNMAQRGYDSNTLVVRIGFDINEAFPKFNFQYKRVLTDEEYDKALEFETDERTNRMLEAPIEEVSHEPESEIPPQKEDGPPVGQSPAARKAAAQQQTPQPAPASAPAPVQTASIQSAPQANPTPNNPGVAAVNVPVQSNGSAGAPQAVVTTVTDVGKKLDSLLGGIIGAKK